MSWVSHRGKKRQWDKRRALPFFLPNKTKSSFVSFGCDLGIFLTLLIRAKIFSSLKSNLAVATHILSAHAL